MKTFLAILLGLALYPILADLTELIDDKMNTRLWVKVGVPSYGLTLGLTGRCTNYVRPNGITNRNYFGCGSINNTISDILYKGQ